MNADACAKELLDVVPVVMRFIRTEMRSHRTPGLSVPQFRALMYVHRNKGVSLMSVSEHLGLTPPTTSILVDRLTRRALLRRAASPKDRRRITLALTANGIKAMETTLRETQCRLAFVLEGLAPAEMRTVTQSMSFLRRIFSAVGHASR